MSHLLADLDATCSALGCSDGERYYTGPDAIQCLKHLIWIMRRDADSHEYRRHIGKAKVLQIDLLNILIDYGEEDEEYFDIVVRLLIILTTPTLLLYKDGPPKDTHGRRLFMELIEILQNYKNAFTNNRVWEVLFNKLKKTVEIDWALRTEDQGVLIERVLILIRNVLQVPANPENEGYIDGEANIHDQIIWVLHHSRILDLVLFIISSKNEKQYHLHCLEIIYQLFREQEVENLVKLSLKEEKERDEQELCALRQRERKQSVLKPNQTRHSRFGGTFVLRNLKTFSGRDIICHHPLKRAEDYDFDKGKQEKKRPHYNANNSKPLKRRSAFSVRLCLREYCVEILASSFNTIILEGRQLITAGAGEKNADMSYLLWAIRFFMEYNRLSDMKVEIVSGALNVQTFHWTLTCMQHIMDMMVTQKKEKILWSKRLHIGIQTFRELLLSVLALSRLPSESAQGLFRMLLNNVCYVVEYRETILHLLLNYNEAYNSRALLLDVIESANIFTKMMEKFCQDSTVVVQDKKRVRKHKANKKGKKAPAVKALTEDELCNKWATIASEVSSFLTSNELSTANVAELIPFDAASERTMDEQKSDCMIRLHKLLHNTKVAEAIKLFRGARDVWPEDDTFGSTTSNPEEELLIMREIFMHQIVSANELTEENSRNEEDDTDDNTEDNELEEGDEQVVEKTTNINDFVKRLLHPKVVHACVIVLSDWRTMSTRSLKAVVTVLHRIAYKCSCPAMLYHAKLFRILQEVFHASRDTHHEELRRLGVFIVRKFTEMIPQNPKIFAELLFYKTIRDANELESGYDDTYEGSKKGAWTEEQEDELRYLFEENQRNPQTDGDVIDWILENLIDKSRTRRGVMKKLRELGLKFAAPTKKSTARIQSSSRSNWSADDDNRLRDLYEEHRAEDDCLYRIEAAFEGQRSKEQIAKRMVKLHLIADKSEIWPANLEQEETEEVEWNASAMEREEPSTSQGNAHRVPKKHKSKNALKSMLRERKLARNKLFNAKQVKSILTELLKEEKFVSSVQWLCECIEETIEELAEANGDHSEGDDVPLVPLKVEEKEAIENVQFQELLKGLSIQPPIVGVERYWRIPSSFKDTDLAIRLKVLRGEELETADVEVEGGGEDNHTQGTGNDDDAEEEEEEDEQQVEDGDPSYSNKKDRKRRLFDDSDGDEEDKEEADKSIYQDHLNNDGDMGTEDGEDVDDKALESFEKDPEKNRLNCEEPVSDEDDSRKGATSMDKQERDDESEMENNDIFFSRQRRRKRRLLSSSEEEEVESDANGSISGERNVRAEGENSEGEGADLNQLTKRRKVAAILDEDDE